MVFKKILLQNEEPEFHGIIWAKPEKDSIDLKIWRGTSWWTVAASSFTPEQISQIIEAVSEQISPEDLGTLSRDQIYNLLSSKANTSDIPTSLSDLNDDAAHRTVADTEKQVWNNKQNTIQDLSIIRSGANAGATAYQKPVNGIPKTDLANDVQTSLGKADTALQSYTESDPTVPSHVKAIATTDISTWNGKQNALTFDSTPTAGSNNPVTSAGIKAYVDNATPTITMDDTPTSGSSNPVKSSGIYNALQGKQNTLTFDSTPTASSSNPVTSGGVKTALDLKANQSTTYTKTEVDALFDDVAYLGDDDGQATTLDFDPQADTVWNIPQTLGSSQQAQARNNIGAVGSVTVNGTTYTPTNGNVDLGTISGGGGSVTVDSTLSTTSTNPVQNSVITTALNGKVGSSTITSIVSLTETAYNARATKDASTLYVIVES